MLLCLVPVSFWAVPTAWIANAEEAVKTLGIEAQIGKVDNITEIMAFGVMSIPALAVDGKVKSAGKVLNAEEIGKMLDA